MAKKVVRVYFMDESFKAVGIDPSSTAGQLRSVIIEKIGLKEDGCFSIFEKTPEYERCLEPDEKPADIMKAWEQTAAEKAKSATPTPTTTTSTAPSGEGMFFFKKKVFLRDDDREMQDPVAKNLVYIQAVSNVIDSVYICSVEEAIKLAGLKMQITYGDHNPATQQVGFLSQEIKKFVPRHVINSKKLPDWESQVIKEHGKVKGKTGENAKSEYLQIVKTWRDYGTTFFPGCKTINSKNLPGKVLIGVNFEGLRLFKFRTRETISEHLFTEILNWSSSPTTFSFEFGNQPEATRCNFETKQGPIIASTVQTYIDILVQMMKKDDEDDPSSSVQDTK
eukprot:TRINITY_DN1815_c0_g1_i2.p1 TRINITY_DN1815_c0_g1~~TRINITY_DN1815_c0_g1_i2.p1  ORF type:complete len:336 (-),score=94.72 TRINITY_DN1815_c0_g1_i2:92-1099(-)